MNSLNYFNQVASDWNHMRAAYFDESLKHQVIGNEAIDHAVVADLGAGTGFLTLELAKRAGLVFSVDQSRNMLAELKQSVHEHRHDHVYPIKGSMTDLPLFDESMDFVFTNMALHHIERPEEAFSEMHRILKSGGVMVISDVEAHNGTWAYEEMHDVWLGFEATDLKQWAEAAGFKEILVWHSPLKAEGYSSQGEFTQTGIFRLRAVKP